tara:strand:+ start:726 stop:1709 length:984 start_codon:yes stop_codon:yes gene_type:complete
VLAFGMPASAAAFTGGADMSVGPAVVMAARDAVAEKPKKSKRPLFYLTSVAGYASTATVPARVSVFGIIRRAKVRKRVTNIAVEIAWKDVPFGDTGEFEEVWSSNGAKPTESRFYKGEWHFTFKKAWTLEQHGVYVTRGAFTLKNGKVKYGPVFGEKSGGARAYDWFDQADFDRLETTGPLEPGTFQYGGIERQGLVASGADDNSWAIEWRTDGFCRFFRGNVVLADGQVDVAADIYASGRGYGQDGPIGTVTPERQFWTYGPEGIPFHRAYEDAAPEPWMFADSFRFSVDASPEEPGGASAVTALGDGARLWCYKSPAEMRELRAE